MLVRHPLTAKGGKGVVSSASLEPRIQTHCFVMSGWMVPV